YSAVGVDLRVARGTRLPPGRGFVEGHLMMQGAIATRDGTAADELPAIRAMAAELGSRSTQPGPPPVRLLPSELRLASIEEKVEVWNAVLGVDEDVRTRAIDLSVGHFLVAGPYRSGRTTALLTIVRSLQRSTPGATFHLFAPRRSALADLDIWARISRGIDACQSSAADLAERLRPALVADGSPTFVVIDDADELFDSDASYALERVARAGRDGSARFVAAAENHALHRAFGGLAAEIRKDKHGLLLDPDVDIDGDLLGVRLPRRAAPATPAGRGYLVWRGRIELIQVAIS
ncbi:MAG: hypothetical protein M3238_07970, partial [Actinomycetota bacterium]|nr:hypothetical protein [Actinomycetota bacterium]